MGTKTAEIPAKKTNVIFKICFFSLNAEARYAGRSTVIQHGAKSATIPAKNDAIIDAEKSISIVINVIIKVYVLLHVTEPPAQRNAIQPAWSLENLFQDTLNDLQAPLRMAHARSDQTSQERLPPRGAQPLCLSLRGRDRACRTRRMFFRNATVYLPLCTCRMYIPFESAPAPHCHSAP